MTVPGSNLDNVCVLRTPDDGKRIAAAAKDKNVIVIGTSFIGCIFHSYVFVKESLYAVHAL